jgi:alpha,alpha-trehalase
MQWDLPFGWAPLELIAAEGLRRYGDVAEADRISVEFLSLVLADFRAQGVIREKYDVVARSSATGKNVRFGYSENVIGFGWTNAAWTALYDALSPAARRRLVESVAPPARRSAGAVP